MSVMMHSQASGGKSGQRRLVTLKDVLLPRAGAFFGWFLRSSNRPQGCSLPVRTAKRWNCRLRTERTRWVTSAISDLCIFLSVDDLRVQ